MKCLIPPGAAAEVPLQARTHHAPAQPGPLAHGIVGVRDAQHALLNEVHDLAIERRLEPVRRRGRAAPCRRWIGFLPIDA